MEGKSFFLQEVQTVKEMIDLSREGNHLFLLDELFKGTNTIERIAIAKAVLSALVVQRNLVFISTHDIELASLLKAEYDLYHFCESVEDGVLSFDYKLKSGPVTERNAIRILDICGYPQGGNTGSIWGSRPDLRILILFSDVWKSHRYFGVAVYF